MTVRWPSPEKQRAIAEAVEIYQRRQAEGMSQDAIVADARNQGFSVIDTIKIVRQLYDIGLGEAKIIVTSHPAWAVEAQNMARLADAFIEVMRKEPYATVIEHDDGRVDINIDVSKAPPADDSANDE